MTSTASAWRSCKKPQRVYSCSPVAIGRHRLFQPARTVLGDPLEHAGGVVEVPPHPAIKHDLDLRADRLAHRADERDVLLHPFQPIGRAVAEEPLLRLEALPNHLPGPRRDEAEIVRIAEHRGIAVDFRPGRAAEETVDW